MDATLLINQHVEVNHRKTKLPAYPSAWYLVEMSENLKPLQVVNKKIFGKDFVLFRTSKGEVCLADAYCPHMGGHFGFGGKVDGENLVCPFHHFCFDTKGNCTKTGYGTQPPPKAILKTYPINEKNGCIFVWFHPTDKMPDWEIPSSDNHNWTEIRTKEFVLHAHPQEIAENSVDIGHFSIVHNYRNVQIIKEAEIQGPFLVGAYGFEREPYGFFGAASNGLKAEISFFIYGLGFSFVEVFLPHLQLKTRQYVFAVPIDETQTRVVIGMSVNKNFKRGKIHPMLRLMPRGLALRFLMNKAFSGYANDVSQDFKIWENKIYLDHPALAKGDGPIGKYRQWAKQFYL